MRELVAVALFTDDVEAVKGFYGRLLGSAPENEWPGGAIYAAGSVKLLVHEHTGAMGNGPANQDHVALRAVDLDAECEALLSQGLAFLAEPRDHPWGRSAYCATRTAVSSS